MSSLTEVEAGTLRLLFDAWQVSAACRSPLARSPRRSSLVTSAPRTSSTESSRRAWSRHQVTRGDGWPAKNGRKMRQIRLNFYRISHLPWRRT